jgi:hypothetical protein
MRDVCPGPLATSDQTLFFKHGDRGAHRGTRDTSVVGQLGLGRQLVAWRQLAGADAIAELLGELVA